MDEPGFERLKRARVTIAGLGLMGGSLALALRGNVREITGIDPDPAAGPLALASGTVDRMAGFESACDGDLLILAAPVRAILEQLAALASADPAHPITVLDLGSTKTEIASAMQSLPAAFDPIGGHPMCGKEVSGLAHAEAGLFQDRLFVLTPLARTTPDGLALAQALVAAVGARVLALSPNRHDRLAAVSSHLPYSAAAVLVRAAESLGDDMVWPMAASGFRDTSRLAASDVTMMLDILLTNRQAILDGLRLYQAEMQALAGLLEAADADALRGWLQQAQARRSDLFQ